MKKWKKENAKNEKMEKWKKKLWKNEKTKWIENWKKIELD